MEEETFQRYGVIDYRGVDVRHMSCLSLDLRPELGAAVVDESTLHPPGTFRMSLFPPDPGEPPIAEIVIVVNGRDVRLVAERTNRGLPEITPSELYALRDPDYLRTWRRYLGLAA